MKKNTIMKIVALLLMSSAVAAPAFAVTLQECLDSSLSNSKLLKSFESQIQSSIYSYRRDQSALWPQLSVSGEGSYLKYDERSGLPSGTQGSVTTELSLDLQKLIANYPELSRLNQEHTVLLKSVAQREIKKQVTQDYDRIYVRLRKKQDYLAAAKYFDQHLKDIANLQDMGVDVKLDLLRALVQQKSVNITLNNISGEIKDTVIEIDSMTAKNYQENDFASMEQPDMARLSAGQTVNNQPEDIEKQLPRLYESRLADLDLKIARQTYKQSTLIFVPTLRLGLNNNLSPIDPAVEAYRVFAALDLNLFDFGQKANDSEQLKYSYEAQENLNSENERLLKMRLNQLQADLQTLQSNYHDAVDNLKNAEKSIETAKTYYQRGKIKETDLLNTFSDYLGTKDQMYEALDNYLDKKTELDSILAGINNEEVR